MLVSSFLNLISRGVLVLYRHTPAALLTYSMVQSPSWTANWFAASQEIARISRNPKVHYRTHKRPPPVSILGQPNAVHIPTSHLLEIHTNIIHLFTPRSPQWSPSLRFPHQDPIHPLSSPIRATCPAHLILFDFITRTILSEVYKSPRPLYPRKRDKVPTVQKAGWVSGPMWTGRENLVPTGFRTLDLVASRIAISTAQSRSLGN